MDHSLRRGRDRGFSRSNSRDRLVGGEGASWRRVTVGPKRKAWRRPHPFPTPGFPQPEKTSQPFTSRETFETDQTTTIPTTIAQIVVLKGQTFYDHSYIRP